MLTRTDKRELVKRLERYHLGATNMLPAETRKLINAYYRGIIAQIMFDEPEEDVALITRLEK